MSVAIVSGAGGLIGSESCTRLIEAGLDVIGIENDMRARFFGPEASTAAVTAELARHPEFRHEPLDVRDADAIERAKAQLNMRATINTTFQGNAQAFQDSLSTVPMLIIAALIVVYLILGILYESYIHPLTILSTLPSAGVGALVARHLAMRHAVKRLLLASRRGPEAAGAGALVAELRELNDLGKKASLRVGQKLRVSSPRTLTAGGM